MPNRPPTIVCETQHTLELVHAQSAVIQVDTDMVHNTPASAAAVTHGETLASWSSWVTMISSPGFHVRAIARLKAKVSVVIFAPKATQLAVFSSQKVSDSLGCSVQYRIALATRNKTVHRDWRWCVADNGTPRPQHIGCLAPRGTVEKGTCLTGQAPAQPWKLPRMELRSSVCVMCCAERAGRSAATRAGGKPCGDPGSAVAETCRPDNHSSPDSAVSAEPGVGVGVACVHSRWLSHSFSGFCRRRFCFFLNFESGTLMAVIFTRVYFCR